MLFKRTSADPQGLVGTWKADSIRTSRPSQQKIEAAGSNALRITGRNGVTSTWDFNGKPQPVTGPGMLSGMTNSAKVTDNHTIEITNSREGVLIGKTTFVLSNDGKTLTATGTNFGPNTGEPSITVYDKQ